MAVTLYLAATGHYNLFFPTTLVEPVSSVPNITWTEMEMHLVSFPTAGELGPPASVTHLLHNQPVDYPGSPLLQTPLHQVMVMGKARTGRGGCHLHTLSYQTLMEDLIWALYQTRGRHGVRGQQPLRPFSVCTPHRETDSRQAHRQARSCCYTAVGFGEK